FEVLNTITNPLFPVPGRVPTLEDCSVAIYKNGQAVLFVGNPAMTWVFDYATRSWTRLQIAQPSVAPGAYTGFLKGATVTNVGGRIQMTSDTTTVWELTPGANPSWVDIGGQLGGTPAGFQPGRGSVCFATLLEGGLPVGAGYAIGGRINNAPSSHIFVLSPGGVIEIGCGASTGLSLGPGTTVVSFKLKDDIALPWAVGKVLAHAAGNLPPGSIEIQYSFDNDVTRQIVPRDTITTV